MEKGCKDLRIFIIQGNIIKKFDTEYGFADVKLRVCLKNHSRSLQIVMHILQKVR